MAFYNATYNTNLPSGKSEMLRSLNIKDSTNITVAVLDEPGPGGASHLYSLFLSYNEIALIRLQEAMMWLNKRTADRVDRGVEGKSVI